ncbi:MAG TPA: M24 family metallopeptidase [Woeseiaceae bacterium]|jgi:Xaa-Pro aminopeptidase|nr:M24 family metallopeptidase [Woeseiaceae bacterium]
MIEEARYEPSREEIARRYANTRAAMAEGELDALIVSGSEYTGFEGAVRYLCGFRILHRYAYVLVPMEGEPTAVFPREATWVGDHTKTFIERQEKMPHCGQWMASECKARGHRRIGVYGLNFIMPVRDYRALVDAGLEIVDFDEAFDHSRAAKSEEELRSVRHSMDINKAGVLAVIQAYRAGMTEAELMGVAERTFTSMGTARKTMDMVLVGPDGSLLPQMVFPDAHRRVKDSDGLLYGLEVAGEGGHWVEFSRLLAPAGIDRETERLMAAYEEFHALVGEHLRAGASAEDVHHKCIKPFEGKGWRLGHVSGHSIGMTMIEFPRIGEGSGFELPENMVCSLHPHVMTEDRRACLYFQETFRVGKNGGESLSGVPAAFYRGGEAAL